MKSFYNYRPEDFVVVCAGSLEEGDMISLVGPNHRYGAAHIDRVTNVRDLLIIIEFDLPDGASIESNPKLSTHLEAKWDGDRRRHVVKVTIEYELVEELQILDIGVDRGNDGWYGAGARRSLKAGGER